MPDQSPTTRVVVAKLSVPVGTTAAAPQKTTVDLGEVGLLRCDIRIPAGHASQTGIAVVYDGQGIVPWATPPDWIIGDAEVFGSEVDFHVGHPLQVWQYNTGSFDHIHYLRFVVTDFADQAAIPTPVLLMTTPATAASGDAGATTGDASVLEDVTA